MQLVPENIPLPPDKDRATDIADEEGGEGVGRDRVDGDGAEDGFDKEKIEEGELQESSEENIDSEVSTELKIIEKKTKLDTTSQETPPPKGYSGYLHSPVKTSITEELYRAMSKPQEPKYDPISPPPTPNLDDFPPLTSIN